MYKTITKIAKQFFTDAQIYTYGFNWSPMYRRTTGKVIHVSDDLYTVKIKIPLNWRNRNYVGTIFGGSMLSATDPIYMIQLMNILGEDYVVWDKAATIHYKRPARTTVFCDFIFTASEIETLKANVALNGETDIVKTPHITTEDGTVIAELSKTMYIAEKSFYKEKQKRKPRA